MYLDVLCKRIFELDSFCSSLKVLRLKKLIRTTFISILSTFINISITSFRGQVMTFEGPLFGIKNFDSIRHHGIQVRPDLYLEVNRLSNPFFYHSRWSIGIDRKWISKYHFVSTCSQSKQSDN